MKQIAKWSIVLFLLAALPVMTAVMAQGQEPTGPQAPAAWNVYESEPNNNRASADVISLNDVVGGVVMYWDNPEWDTCDPDFFRFTMPQAGYVLIDIDTDAIGSRLDPTVKLYGSAGEYLTSIHVEDLETEPLLFYALSAGDYYIFVNDQEDEYCGPQYYYELSVSSPLLVSAAAAKLGTAAVGGISFRSEDILAFSDLNNGQERWAMFFDGSDVGLKTLTNLEASGGDQLLLGMAATHTLPGAGVVTPWDLVEFDPIQYGPDTQGNFSLAFDGSANQLTTASEKLDAIATSQHCDYLSTTGTATVPYYMGYNIKFKDEDLGCWYADDEWLYGFESRNVTGLPVEDVFAAAYDDAADKTYLTILGSGKIAGHAVTQKDIFAINYPGYTWGGYVWRGPQHGWNYNIDAIEWNGP